jgi:hypothetical protein
MNPHPVSPGSASLPDQIREAAYFEWLDRGCPHGDDWAHWFAARKRLDAQFHLSAAANPQMPAGGPKFSIQQTLAAHSSDPTHRFHGPGAAHDDRQNVIAGEARQRVRGRHFGGSLRAQPKPRQ